jgi:hypothetical protein
VNIYLLLYRKENKIMTIPKGLAARAVIHSNTMKSKMVIEIREGTRFANFYHTYSVTGRGRNRTITPGLSRHRGFADSLEEVVEQIVKAMKAHAKRQKVDLVMHTTIHIYRKRLYRKLFAMRPDELGLTNVACKFGTRQPSNGLIRMDSSVLRSTRMPVTHDGS